MPSYNFDTIFSLDARSNCLLDLITEQYSLSDSRVFAEVQSAFVKLKELLTRKGVQYRDLKRALVPNHDQFERVFVFDWTQFETSWYGKQVHELMLPLLERSSSRSVLVGDWISRERFPNIYRQSFGREPDPRMMSATRADTLYFVYLNNLTAASAARIDSSLSNHRAYAGCIDLTYISLMKVFLSTMLAQIYIQHRSIILQGHEDDRYELEDVDLIGYGFKSAGYMNRSVPLWLYSWFLSYKIERPVLSDEDSDIRFSLNAMTPMPAPIAECQVELDERKLAYLQEQKAGSLRRADFHTLSAEAIAAQVREKLSSNYIFNLSKARDGDTLKFNIVLENPGIARYLCALEYQPRGRKLRIITLY